MIDGKPISSLEENERRLGILGKPLDPKAFLELECRKLASGIQDK
jgi:hypothetical protein